MTSLYDLTVDGGQFLAWLYDLYQKHAANEDIGSRKISYDPCQILSTHEKRTENPMFGLVFQNSDFNKRRAKPIIYLSVSLLLTAQRYRLWMSNIYEIKTRSSCHLLSLRGLPQANLADNILSKHYVPSKAINITRCAWWRRICLRLTMYETGSRSNRNQSRKSSLL